MGNLNLRIAACVLSLGMMTATTVGAFAQKKEEAKPAAKPAAPAPAARPAPPPPPRVAPPPPPVVRQAPPPPVVRQAPPPPVVRQAPVQPSGPPAAFRQQQQQVQPPGPPPGFRQQQQQQGGPSGPPGGPPAAFRQQQQQQQQQQLQQQQQAQPPGPPPGFRQQQQQQGGPSGPPSGPPTGFRQQQQQQGGPSGPPAGGPPAALRQQEPGGPPSQANVPLQQQQQQQLQQQQQGLAPRTFGPGQGPRRDGDGNREVGRGDRDGARNLSRHPGLRGNNNAAAAAGANLAVTPQQLQLQQQQQQRFGGQRPPGFRADGTPSPARALRNQTFANPARLAGRSALANSTFRGRFAGVDNFQRRQRFHRARVLGWVGPLFWPYAYNDMFDYAFWPYAYDTFWPYAYDDVYTGMFGPYAYGYGPNYALQAPGGYPPPGGGPGPDGLPPDTNPTGGLDREAQVCSEQPGALTNYPIEQIANTVQPTAQQRVLLNRLGQATGRGVQILQAACPTQLANTPTGRLAALHSRLDAMLRAVDTIGPAMKAFYDSLNDEQRAKFDALGEDRDQGLVQEERNDLTQVCGAGGGAGIALPIDRIEDEVRPEGYQRAALNNLQQASERAGERLRANCPTGDTLTPPGRIDAMRQRLAAMLEAVVMVRPALDAFYGTLTYEQRARFNVIGGQEG